MDIKEVVKNNLIKDAEDFYEENKSRFDDPQFCKYFDFLKNCNAQFLFELFGTLNAIHLGELKTKNLIEAASSIDYELNDDGALSLLKVSIDSTLNVEGIDREINYTIDEYVVVNNWYDEITLEYIDSVKTSINHTWENGFGYTYSNLRFIAVPMDDKTLDMILVASKLYDKWVDVCHSSQDDINDYIKRCYAEKDKIYTVLDDYIYNHDRHVLR